jgi:hypothetical protein
MVTASYFIIGEHRYESYQGLAVGHFRKAPFLGRNPMQTAKLGNTCLPVGGLFPNTPSHWLNDDGHLPFFKDLSESRTNQALP